MRFLLFLMVILTQCGWQFPSGWQNDFPWQKCGDGSGCVISSPSTVNVGIGTTQSVPNKLYVVGDIFATGTISDGSGSVGPWTQSGTNVILTTSTNNVGIGNDTTPDASLEIIQNGSVPPLAVSSTNVSAAGDRFVVTSAGNVGIGTTAPSQMLEVNSGASGTSLIQINASNNVNGFKAGFLSGLGGVLGTSSFNILSLQTNNSEKMRIDGSGNVGIGTIITGNAGLSIMNGAVGIGTWVPASAFAIEGPDQTNSRIGTGSNTYYTQYGTVSGTPTNARAFVGLASGNHAVLQGGAGKDIYLYVNGATFGSGTIALAADVNGNVGIGTITPIGGLSVMNGNVGIGTWVPGALLQIGNQNGTGLRITSSGGFTNISGNASAALNSTSLNLQNSGGAISINNNTATAGSSVLLTGSLGAANGSLTLQSTNAASASGDFINFKGGNNGTTVIATMLGTGNVGIGTTNPNSELSINGTMTQQWASKIPVLTSCGGGSPTVKGTDNDFQITVGTVATGCTATFGRTTYSDATCTVSNQSMSITSALGYTVSPTAIVISQGVGLSGDLLNVHCGFKN